MKWFMFKFNSHLPWLLHRCKWEKVLLPFLYIKVFSFWGSIQLEPGDVIRGDRLFPS